ncbi:MAG TPA: aromatic amino acid transport family protein [Parachlamydiaceae bacterium]|nr:aromatic amino acid transport family protein [Parachlamydiaceae bacterium]
MNTYGNLIRGTLLIAGTSIGGGMLALPVLTSQVGFFPSIAIYFMCWLFMMSTGLLFLEVSLWMGKGANIISMAEYTLGKWGKVAAWCLYLFLFYCLTLAYIVGAGNLVAEAMNGTVTDWQAQVLFLLIFAPFVYAGAHLVGRFNVFLMLGLGVSYLIFVFLGFPHVRTDLLLATNWSKAWTALPITFTAFAYQGTIPTLVEYMKRDVKHTRLAIIIGSFLPLIAYTIWQGLILGIVPLEGPNSLDEAIQAGQNAVQPLKNILDISSVYIVGQYFAFFALLTSFFGVTLGLLDFWADGLKVKKTQWSKFWLCLLIFVPPLLFAFVYPHVFLMALDYAGGFGCALLLGLMPVLMVWSGRYRMGLKGEYTVWGGRMLLSALISFVLIELVCQFTVISR